MSACILTGSISAVADENAVKALSEESSRYAAEDFIRSYYSSIYLDSEMKSQDRTEYSGLAEYIETKLDYLQYVTSDVENFNVSTEIKDKRETENGILFTVWAEADFNYVGSDTPSGFGRTAQVLVGSDNRIVDMWINDGIEDNFRANGIEPSELVWSNYEIAEKRISDISLCRQNCINYEQELLKSSQMYTDNTLSSENASDLNATSSLSSAQRNKMVSYALNNVDIKQPSSGDSSFVSDYFDFSRISGAGDCTNFVSHCLLAGGAVFKAPSNYKTGGVNSSSSYWFYHNIDNRASSWSGVENFYSFITTNKGVGPKGTKKPFSGKYPPNQGYEAIKGDIVQIRYNSDENNDSVYDHTMIITDVTFDGTYWNVHLTGRSGFKSGVKPWYDMNTKFSETRFEKENDDGETMDCDYRSIHLTSLT